MDVVIAILAIGALIVIHEAGHFAVARLCGMRVDVFSIGFGPSLVSWRGKQTEYRLAVLPLGGYVRIAGMAPGDGTPEDEPRSFANKPLWQRFAVLFAGPFTNWLFAFLLLVVLLIVGLERASPEPVIGKVRDGSPAAVVGLRPGDRVLQADGTPITGWQDLVEAIGAHRARPLELRLQRDGREVTLTPTVGRDGRLGVIPSVALERYPFGQAIGLAFVRTGAIVGESLAGIAAALRGSKEAQLTGPVGIVGDTAEAVHASTASLFMILVLISLALALMNVLPLPALDGGRLLFVVIGMVRRRPVSANFEAVVHAVGFILILGLIAWATYGDIGRLMNRTPAASSQGATPPAQGSAAQPPPASAPQPSGSTPQPSRPAPAVPAPTTP